MYQIVGLGKCTYHLCVATLEGGQAAWGRLWPVLSLAGDHSHAQGRESREASEAWTGEEPPGDHCL